MAFWLQSAFLQAGDTVYLAGLRQVIRRIDRKKYKQDHQIEVITSQNRRYRLHYTLPIEVLELSLEEAEATTND